MLCERIKLPVQYREKGIKNNDYTPIMDTYILANSKEIDENRKRPFILVCPGGGYVMTSEREGEPVAVQMNTLGFHSGVLYYSCAPMDFPAAYLDLCEAVHYIRSHADEWNVDPDQIVVCGFSAAGHLAASLGVWWNTDLHKKYLPYSNEDVKPNGLMLGYPVITSGEYRHDGSIHNLLGSQDTSKDLWKKASLENQVNKDVPPVFLWHTDEDGCVPLENSLFFVNELRKNHIPLEYHVFTKGGHGLSLATKETSFEACQIVEECQIWPQLFKSWMNTGVITDEKRR